MITVTSLDLIRNRRQREGATEYPGLTGSTARSPDGWRAPDGRPRTGHTPGRLAGSSGHSRALGAQVPAATSALMRPPVASPTFQAGDVRLNDALRRAECVNV